jgi:drug/metabolite transporter (DMT)-like permease
MARPDNTSPCSHSTGYDPLTAGSVVLAVVTCILWGGTAVSNQFVMDVMPPLYVGGLRFTLAAVFMLIWCLWTGAPVRLSRKQWIPVHILGLLLFLQIATFNIGADRSSTSHASILVNSYIFWVPIWEHLITRTIRLDLWQWAGLLLATFGCGWVFLEAVPGTTMALDIPTIEGDLILTLSGLILAVKIIYTKECVRQIAPATAIFWHDLVGTALFFLTAPLFETLPGKPFPVSAWVALLFSGFIVSGFCFGANAILLKKHGASQVSVFSFLTPIFGVILGIWLRGDLLSWSLVLGGILVTVGIALVNRTPRVSDTPTPASSAG